MATMFYLVCALGLAAPATAANILLLPFHYTSIVKSCSCLGNQLTDHGHNVYMALPSTFLDLGGLKKRIKFEVFEFSLRRTDPVLFYTTPLDDQHTTPNVRAQLRENSGVELCHDVLESEEIPAKVREYQISVAIVFSSANVLCFAVLPYKLGLPFISMLTQPDPWLIRSPALPSFVPYSMHSSFTNNMTFWERLQNTWIQIDWEARGQEVESAKDGLIIKYAPNKPPISMNTLLGKALLWLVESDPVIDYTRPIMPNEIEVAGFTTAPASPLPAKIQEFLDSAKGGVIVAAHGSLSSLGDKNVMKIMRAFQMLPKDIHIIWKYPAYKKATKPQTAENMLLLDWLPQNDILGHPNTRLFINHCGAYGQHEALYHGVPMLGIPLFWDQHYNCQKVVHKGFAERIEIPKLTTERLYALITKMLATDTYSDKIKHASKIFRSRKMHPTEKAAVWVDHVIEFGASHLRSHSLDMPWYEFIMLDILAFVMALFILFCTAMYCMCLYGYRKLQRKQKQKVL